MQHPKVLLFDLGGVIVRWVGLHALSDKTGLSLEEVKARFARSQIFRDYETGRRDDDTFTDELISQFNLAIPREAVKDLWNSWVQESYAGTKDMLITLRTKYTIACLSNTNALHWGHLPKHIKIDEFFDYSYASHLITAAKPDPVSYEIPIHDMGVSPSDIWFFDDTLINVEAAKSAGMEAFHVDREVGVIPTLKELGLLT